MAVDERHLGLKRWIGDKPRECDICKTTRVQTQGWVDGRTVRGPWANMCLACHKRYGVGLGTGNGQQYNKEGVKIDG